MKTSVSIKCRNLYSSYDLNYFMEKIIGFINDEKLASILILSKKCAINDIKIENQSMLPCRQLNFFEILHHFQDLNKS